MAGTNYFDLPSRAPSLFKNQGAYDAYQKDYLKKNPKLAAAGLTFAPYENFQDDYDAYQASKLAPKTPAIFGESNSSAPAASAPKDIYGSSNNAAPAAPANVSGGQASVPTVQQRMSNMGNAVQAGMDKGLISSNYRNNPGPRTQNNTFTGLALKGGLSVQYHNGQSITPGTNGGYTGYDQNGKYYQNGFESSAANPEKNIGNTGYQTQKTTKPWAPGGCAGDPNGMFTGITPDGRQYYNGYETVSTDLAHCKPVAYTGKGRDGSEWVNGLPKGSTWTAPVQTNITPPPKNTPSSLEVSNGPGTLAGPALMEWYGKHPEYQSNSRPNSQLNNPLNDEFDYSQTDGAPSEPNSGGTRHAMLS